MDLYKVIKQATFKIKISESAFIPKKLDIAVLVASLGMASSAMALEPLDDETLANKTGEGLGLIVKDLKIAAEQNAYVRVTSAGGTPVPADAFPGTKKAEVYMYGFSIGGSNAKNDANVLGANIGSADNPIVLNMTDKKLPDNSETGVISIKMPAVKDGLHPANSNAGKNLKMVTWVDVLGRDAATYTRGGFGGKVDLNGDNDTTDPNEDFSKKAYLNNLRMQVMADKFTLNGTKVSFFKTGKYDAGPLLTTGIASFDEYLAKEKVRMENAYSNKVANYGVLRINYETDNSPPPSTPADIAAYNPLKENNGYFKWSVALNAGQTGSTPKVEQNNIYGNGYGAAVTDKAPIFNNKAGLYVKDFQINLPLGSIFQPTILDTNGDGALSLEVARIPNKPSIYSKHYINYPDHLSYNSDGEVVYQADGVTPVFTKLKAANGTDVVALSRDTGYCTPTKCPSTATHATAYFRTFSLNQDGNPNKDFAQANASDPFIPYQDRGYGLKGLKSGLAGIKVDGLQPLDVNTAPTYNMAEGMVVNHIKITLNQ